MACHYDTHFVLRKLKVERLIHLSKVTELRGGKAGL